MCIICGDIDHIDNDLLEKAIRNKKKSKKEKPRFKGLADLEKEFRIEFAEAMSDMADELLTLVDKYDNEVQ